MKVLVTGSSGMIGSAIVSFLANLGHQPVPLLRPTHWNPDEGTIDVLALEGVDAVVHLAGQNIAGGRWTARRKAQIRDSRVLGTRLLSDALARLERRPAVLVSASATGYYGDRGNELLREDSPAGKGFLPEVCRHWEAATDAATRAGIRVVHLRLGIVLSREGGALAKMLLPFRSGFGGRIGSGQQYWSWISLDDVCGAILHVIQASGLHGPVNAVSPTAVTNTEFTKTLGRVLSRPTVLPMPVFAARLVLGEMADELLLASARVEPVKLISSRYGFQHRDLETALRSVLQKDR
jgi:uncharacterized protein (TIGR01777 family)